MARKSPKAIQYKIRVRADLRRRIEKAAAKNGVSANYEMVRRLERSFDQEAVAVNQSVQSINQAAVNAAVNLTPPYALHAGGGGARTTERSGANRPDDSYAAAGGKYTAAASRGGEEAGAGDRANRAARGGGIPETDNIRG
jgi:hypothetical protein